MALLSCKAAEQTEAVAEDAAVASSCAVEGFLSADLVGAIATKIAWQQTELDCAGMPRPDGAGARLRFAGPLPDTDERRLAIIIAIPELVRGETGTELPSNVTVNEEGTGRFFSTADLNNCWTDISSIETSSAAPSAYEIAGALYCVAPLAEINGDTSITIAELQFHGFLDWDAS